MKESGICQEHGIGFILAVSGSVIDSAKAIAWAFLRRRCLGFLSDEKNSLRRCLTWRQSLRFGNRIEASDSSVISNEENRGNWVQQQQDQALFTS